jgi:hypothetical protein
MANVVQYVSNTVTSTTTDTLSFKQNVSQNDVLVAVVSTLGAVNHVQSIIDSLGLTWYKLSQSNYYNDIEVWYAVASATQLESVTVYMANTGDINLTLIEISGLNINNLVAGQYIDTGENVSAEITISPALNNVFVLSAINLVIPSSASPSPNQAPSASPISPAILLTTNSIASDNETTAIEYVANASSLSTLGFQNITPSNYEFDMTIVIFNISTTTISTSPCASLPFPLNSICYAINSISSSVINTGQGIMGGLGYFAQSFYQAITGLANNIYNGIISISTNFYNAIVNFGNAIETALSNFGQWLYNGLNYIYTGLSNFGNWLYAGFEDFVKTLITFFNWTWQGLVNIFNTIYTAFTNGIDTLFTSFESGIVTMQNTFVSKLSKSVAVAIIMPSEFELSKAFVNGIAEFNKKKILGSLGGMFVIPLIAGFIGDLLQGIISPQAISKIFPRPNLPSIAIPTQTLSPVTPTATPSTTPPPTTSTTSSVSETTSQLNVTTPLAGTDTNSVQAEAGYPPTASVTSEKDSLVTVSTPSATTVDNNSATASHNP